MTIEPFNIVDVYGFKPNPNSPLRYLEKILDDVSYHKYSLIDEENVVQAIICFKDNGDDDWAGFFLIAETFKGKHGLEIKHFIVDTVEKHQARRLWTASRPGTVLDRWHQFLGMQKDKEMVNIEGSDFNIWSMEWERK